MRYILILMITMLCMGSVAQAHPKTPTKTGPRATVTVTWTWVSAHWARGKWVRGHWSHPAYGHSYRNRAHGPPPPRPHHAAQWVPGHWERRRGPRGKVWVPGHWRR